MANLYATTLLRTLKQNHRKVELGALLDDRNLATNDWTDLVEILETTADFDACVGLKTNLAKSVIFANTPSLRKAMEHCHTRTGHPRCHDGNMVGHQVVAMSKRDVRLASAKAGKVAARSKKVSGLPMTKKQKARLIQNAIILAAVAGTLWDIPTKKSVGASQDGSHESDLGQRTKVAGTRNRPCCTQRPDEDGSPRFNSLNGLPTRDACSIKARIGYTLRFTPSKA